MTDRKEVLALVERLRIRPTIRLAISESKADNVEAARAIRDMMVDRSRAADMLEALAPAEGGELEMETTEPMRNALFGERDDNDILAMLGRDFDRQSARIRELEAARSGESGTPVARIFRSDLNRLEAASKFEAVTLWKPLKQVWDEKITAALYLAPPPADAGLRIRIESALAQYDEALVQRKRDSVRNILLAATPPNPTGDA